MTLNPATNYTLQADDMFASIDGNTNRMTMQYYDQSTQELFADEFLALDLFGLAEVDNEHRISYTEYYFPPPTVYSLPSPRYGYLCSVTLENGAQFNYTYELSRNNETYRHTPNIFYSHTFPDSS